MVDEVGALWIPNNNFFPSRYGATPRYIIIHGTAGFTNALDVAYYFQTVDVGSHYIVGRDAKVVQTILERDGAWANGGVTAGHDAWWSDKLNPNLVTISIEHVKPSKDNSDLLTDAQKIASFQLIQHICERHDIPKRFADAIGGITGHFSMDPVNRSGCPNTYPWQELFAYLATTENNVVVVEDDMAITIKSPGIAQFFEEISPTVWRCKVNGFVIRDGMLVAYKRNGGLWRLPTGNEYSPFKNHAQVAEQAFEVGTARYDPDRVIDRVPGSDAVYLVHIEQDVRYITQTSLVSQDRVTIQQLTQEKQKLSADNLALKADIAMNSSVGLKVLEALKPFVPEIQNV